MGPRAKSLTFPNGRTLTVVGENHGSRDFPTDLADLLIEDKEKGGDKEFATKLATLTESAGIAARSQEQNLHFLRTTLARDKKIEFVAIEATPDVQARNEKFFEKLKRHLERATQRPSLLPSLQHRSALLVSLGAATFLKATEPEMLKGRTILGAESADAVAAEERASRAAAFAQYELLKAAGDRKELQESIISERNRLNEMARIAPENLDRIQILAELRKRWGADRNTKLNSATEVWVNKEFASFEALRARDRATSRVLVERRQSGIYFVGYHHLNSLMSELKLKCRVEAALEKVVAP